MAAGEHAARFAPCSSSRFAFRSLRRASGQVSGARRRAGSCPLLDAPDGLAQGHGLAGGHGVAQHAGFGGGDLHFHLHGFHHGDELAGLHGGAVFGFPGVERGGGGGGDGAFVCLLIAWPASLPARFGARLRAAGGQGGQQGGGQGEGRS